MNLDLSVDSSRKQAIRWLQQLIRDLGLGFHPDTDPDQYVWPNGQPVLTPDQCAILDRSLQCLFTILGDNQPYDVAASLGSAMLARSLGLKPPLHYHDPDFQRQLLEDGTREQLMAWLCWNDPNGTYADQGCRIEGDPPLTLDEARAIVRRQIEG